MFTTVTVCAVCAFALVRAWIRLCRGVGLAFSPDLERFSSAIPRKRVEKKVRFDRRVICWEGGLRSEVPLEPEPFLAKLKGQGGRRLRSGQRGVRFQEHVVVVPIEDRHHFTSERVRSSIWSSKYEIRARARRNLQEMAYEGLDWRTVPEEDQMYRDALTGRFIHPVHVHKEGELVDQDGDVIMIEALSDEASGEGEGLEDSPAVEDADGDDQDDGMHEVHAGEAVEEVVVEDMAASLDVVWDDAITDDDFDLRDDEDVDDDESLSAPEDEIPSPPLMDDAMEAPELEATRLEQEPAEATTALGSVWIGGRRRSARLLAQSRVASVL